MAQHVESDYPEFDNKTNNAKYDPSCIMRKSSSRTSADHKQNGEGEVDRRTRDRQTDKDRETERGRAKRFQLEKRYSIVG